MKQYEFYVKQPLEQSQAEFNKKYGYTEPKPKRKRRRKKRLEFMQTVIIISFAFALLWVTNSYLMAWCDKINPLENLSGIVVSAPIASIIGYAVQNCSRAKWFKDKTKDGDIYGNTGTAAGIFTENNPLSDSRYDEN